MAKWCAFVMWWFLLIIGFVFSLFSLLVLVSVYLEYSYPEQTVKIIDFEHRSDDEWFWSYYPIYETLSGSQKIRIVSASDSYYASDLGLYRDKELQIVTNPLDKNDFYIYDWYTYLWGFLIWLFLLFLSLLILFIGWVLFLVPFSKRLSEKFSI